MQIQHSGRHTGRAVGALGLALFAGTAIGQDAIPALWDEPVSGAWSDGARWSTGQSPNNNEGQTFDAFITIGSEEPYEVDIDVDVFLRDLAITANANLRVAGTSITTTSNLTLAGGGRISGDGENPAAVTVGGNALIADSNINALDNLDFNGDAVISNASLTNISSFRTGVDRSTVLANVSFENVNVESRGDLFITGEGITREDAVSLSLCDTCVDHGDGVISWNSSTSIALVGAADFQISSGGSLNSSDDSGGSIMGQGDGLQNFTNEGTVNIGTQIAKKNRGDRLADVAITGLNFENLGEVRVQSGQLTVDGLVNFVEPGQLVGGSYTVLDTATLVLNDSDISMLNAGITLVGEESTLTALDTLQMIGSDGVLDLRGGRDFTTQEDLTNDGEVRIAAGSVLDVSSGGINNVVQGELIGGTYVVEGGIRDLVFNGEGFDGAIVELSSNVTLIGETSTFEGLDTLARIGEAGTLALEEGKTFETVGSLDVADGALVRVGESSTLQVNGFLGNFVEGLFNAASFEIAGTLIAENAAIESISNELILDGTESVILDLQGNDALEQIRRINSDGILRLRNGRQLQTIANLEVEGILSIDPGPGFSPLTVGADAAQLEIGDDLIVGENAVIALALLDDEIDLFGDINVADQLIFGDDGVAGTLQLVVGPEFDAELGSELMLITAGSVEGVFENVEVIQAGLSGLTLIDNFDFELFYTDTGVGARVVPTPGAAMLALPGVLLAARRRRATASHT
ncbi:MAG: hypothetical protein AAFP26_04065 [Planctomycetota bacterium]